MSRETHLEPALSAKGLMWLPLAMALPMVASVLGGLFTAPALATWYVALKKPFFTPPNVVFPLVWTFLYALMAVAFWRILRARPETGSKRVAILLFVAQIVLNIGWSYAFFARQSPMMGLVMAGALLLTVAAMMRAFLALDKAAGTAMVLYVGWAAFALALNAGIVLLNR